MFRKSPSPPGVPFTPQLLDMHHPVNLGLVGNWCVMPPLDGGRQWHDLAGMSHGTLTNGPAWSSRVRPGGIGSLTFDGTNDYIDIGAPSALQLGASYTLSAWVRLSANGSFPGVVGWTLAASFGGVAWLLYLSSSNRTVSHAAGGTSVTGTMALTVGQWAFVAVSRTSSGATLWLDAASESVAAGTTPSYSGGGVAVGTFSGAAASSFPFPGNIDDVRIYSRALSAAEIQGLRRESQAGYPEAWRWASPTSYFLPPASLNNYSLSCAAGPFAEAGVSASLKAGWKVVCSAGSYVETGLAASLKAGFREASDTGAFALSGQSASLLATRRLACAAGSYSLTGQAATVKPSRRLSCDTGAFSVTGRNATLTYSGGTPVVQAPPRNLKIGISL